MDRWHPASPQHGWPPPPPTPLPVPAASSQTAAASTVRVIPAASAQRRCAAGASGTTAAALGPASGSGPALYGGRGMGLGGRHGFGGAGGTLTAIDASSLTVRGRDGQTVKIATTSSTTYYRDTAKVNRTDLKVGDRVVVNLTDPQASSPTAGAVRIVLPSVVGTVSGVQADSFTLTDQIGFRHTIAPPGRLPTPRTGSPRTGRRW